MDTQIGAFGDLDVACLAAWTVAGEIRQRIGIRCATWGLSGISDDAFLIADELIVNACTETPDREIRIRFTKEPGSVLLCVWDSSCALPIARQAAEPLLDDITPDPLALDVGHDDGTGGWGLSIRAPSSKCAVTPTPPQGKWVWARLPVLQEAR